MHPSRTMCTEQRHALSIHPTPISALFDRSHTFNPERLLPDTEQHHTQNSLAMILSFTVTGSSSL
jgi:hypothetical protein